MNNTCCHMTSAHSADDARIFHKECVALVKAGYDVSLIAPHSANETQEGVRIIAVPKAAGRISRMFVTTYRVCVAALKQRSGIYHFHDPELMFAGLFLKLWTGRRVVYDVHEDYAVQSLSKEYLPRWFRPIAVFLIRIIERMCARFFDGIVAATDDIAKNFSCGRNVIVLKNFPRIAAFQGARKRASDKRMFTVAYVGGLSRGRGIAEIVKASGLAKNINLVLAGSFDSQEYQKSVLSMPEFRGVTWLGRVGYRDIPNLLINADAGIVCLYPLQNYLSSLPVKMFEYMVAGLPIIASDFFSSIIEGSRCGVLVDPKNPRQIAQAMNYLALHREEAKEMGERGKKAVASLYNWEREAEKLLNLYEKLSQS